jgi:hypothetical protein
MLCFVLFAMIKFIFIRFFKLQFTAHYAKSYHILQLYNLLLGTFSFSRERVEENTIGKLDKRSFF